MVSTNSTAELAVISSRAGQEMIVTHHFRMTEVGTGRSLQDLIDKWQAAAQTQFLGLFSPDTTLVKIRARHVCGTIPLDATTEEAVNSVGTRTAAPHALPPWFAAVVRCRTASAGRSYRGRFYLPLTDEADFEGDVIQSNEQTILQAYVSALGGAFLSGGSQAGFWQLVVHSRKLASVPGTQCQASSTIITSLALQTALTTQRSRRARPA